jgi:O-antigen/teichoic acid export membrane protein
MLTPQFALRVYGFEPVLGQAMLERLEEPASNMGTAQPMVLARQPEMGRDSAWLASTDILAVFLALFGQVLLTRALSTEEFGLFIIAFDAFATLFLIVDLGLPTLLARDGTKALNRVWPSIARIYRLQAMVLVPFLLLACVLTPLIDGDWRTHSFLLGVCACIALAHIASYAPRTALRVAGEARLEAMTKLIERGITVAGYGVLFWLGSTSVTMFALVFLIGALIGFATALWWSHRLLAPLAEDSENRDLGEVWATDRSLLLHALPFAITLGVLPYVVRIEKFLVGGTMGLDSAALFHVAQLAWLAGLVVPQAMRSALLPLLGERREQPEAFAEQMGRSLDLSMGLLPYGLYGGAFVVWFSLPVAFPQQYTDGSLGASAVQLFMILLFGWCCTVLATPTYTALQAGPKPWHFTWFIVSVVTFAASIGAVLIQAGSHVSVEGGLLAAAIASSATAAFMLLLSLRLAAPAGFVANRAKEWSLCIGLSLTTCIGFVVAWPLALTGVALFVFTPRGLEAVRSIGS